MSAKNGKHIPDDYKAEVLICPDEGCHRMIDGKSAIGRPPCAAPLHKRTGRYPRMDRVVVGIEDRIS